MFKLNQNYKNLKPSYLFSDIAKRVAKYQADNPKVKIIKMGIGDVTQPLCTPVVEALKSASLDMGKKETFHGYGPEQGYPFIREAIAKYYKDVANVDVDDDEIFVSDGAKSDVANITDLFDNDNVVVLPDPVYPVYYDSNLMLGRKIVLIKGDQSNEFLPMPTKDLEGDIFYLCSPNNPTGAVYSKDQLKQWVDFANDRGAIILYDAAYEAFVTDKNIPRSILEIEGARTCAVEFCSLSKTAGFTGTRCGYTVIPKEIEAQGLSLNKMWLRRQSTKYNGVPYIIQKGAEAVFTKEGLKATADTIKYYQRNANTIAETLKEIGIFFTGGTHSPYIWLKSPKGMTSWEFFDKVLNEAGVVGTPGSGFGECGEGYFRLSAFNTYENTVEAMSRIKKIFSK